MCNVIIMCLFIAASFLTYLTFTTLSDSRHTVADTLEPEQESLRNFNQVCLDKIPSRPPRAINHTKIFACI